MKVIKLCVIGVGYLGRIHAKKLSQMEGVKLIGVSDLIEERAKNVAEECNTIYSIDYSDIIKDADAVVVAVTTDNHYKVSKDVIREGKHLFLEKPMTVTPEEAKELILLSQEYNRILQIGHLERFNPAFQAMIKRLDTPTFIKAVRCSPFQKRGTEVDVVLDLMIHDLDLILSIIPSKISHIKAQGQSIRTPFLDEAQVELIFENGCKAVVEASRVAKERKREMYIFQESYNMMVDFANFRLLTRKENGKKSPLEELFLGDDILEENFSSADPIRNELFSFVNAIRRGDPVLVGGIDGYRALLLAQDIVRYIHDAG